MSTENWSLLLFLGVCITILGTLFYTFATVIRSLFRYWQMRQRMHRWTCSSSWQAGSRLDKPIRPRRKISALHQESVTEYQSDIVFFWLKFLLMGLGLALGTVLFIQLLVGMAGDKVPVHTVVPSVSSPLGR